LLLFLPLAALAVLAVAIVAFAGPVGQSAGFEDDDGNLAPGDVMVPGQPSPNFDWNSFDPVTWSPHPATTPTRQTDDKSLNGFQFKGIEDYPNPGASSGTTADTSFNGGVKQDTNCAGVGTGKPPNKDDLTRVYLASKVINGQTFLELAWARIPQNSTSSSAHVGFEFNQGTTACPAGSDGLVQRTAGDILIVYDFEGGSEPVVLTLRKWVTSGACEVGSNSPPCWGPAQNLTAGGFAEGEVNTANVVDALSPPALDSATGTSVDRTLATQEFGEAGINLTAAGVIPENTCASFGKAYAVSRSSGNSAQAQMKDLVGPADFSLANCGTVIIRKQTVPDGDTTTSFGYTTNVTTSPATTTSPFSLMDDGVNTILNVLPGSGKLVTEDDPGPNYALTNLDCSASTVPAANRTTSVANRQVSFSIAGGETLDCTFTNTLQQGALKILKQSTKTGNPLVSQAGAVFSYDGSSVTDNGAGDEDPTIGEVCVSGLAPGGYTVNETSPPDGYGPAPAGQANQAVTVVANTNCTDNPPGSGATATFTNPPLADIQVNFRDGGSGETSATSITCANTGTTADTTPATGWDDSVTHEDIQIDPSPRTVQCEIVIDP
jgi:hypothetical protein